LLGLLGMLLLNACGDTTATNVPAVAATPAQTSSAVTTAAQTSSAVTTAAQTSSSNPTTAAVSTTQAATNNKLAEIAASLPKLRQAPDWDNQTWLNSAPTKLADLKGKVVLVEFWTFECVNCRNVLPAMRQYYDQFHNKDFALISFHDPEFSAEKDWNNVTQAVKEDEIKYAVAQDNDFKTWNAYGVNAWPTWFLVDKQGIIRYKHIGEGAYDETALNIQALLAAN